MSRRTTSITSQAYHYGISDRSNEGITEEKTDGTWMEWRVRGAGVSQRAGNGEWGKGHAPPFLRAVAVPRNKPCELQISEGLPLLIV